MAYKRPQSVTTDKIARIWETPEGKFVYAIDAGFEEIFWEEDHSATCRYD
jgi:hypothetical protein